MKTIEINTSFNVIISFNLASVAERGLAFLIDQVIIWSTIGLLTLFANLIIRQPSPYLFYFIAAPIFGFYTLVLEIINNGQTPGKMAMRIQVIRIDGKRNRVSDCFMRWIFRLIDIYFSGSLLAILTITASQKGQRLGDILADTCVIKVRERPATSLESILKLDELQEHTPSYPEVTKLAEEDMMVIKECVDRYAKYPNAGHREAVDLLISSLEDLLQIRCRGDKINFLKQLIKDYVILTR